MSSEKLPVATCQKTWQGVGSGTGGGGVREEAAPPRIKSSFQFLLGEYVSTLLLIRWLVNVDVLS